MNLKTFGRTGLTVSPLGFGAAPIGYLKTDRDRIADILNLLLDSGVNLLDTAASYPGSEDAIGDLIPHRRDQFVLVSKCGGKLPDLDDAAWSPSLITKTVDRSLSKLKTDHLDVMLLHSCDLPTLQKGDAIATLVKARDAGKVRHVGYSGDNDAAAFAAAHPEISVIETSISIADQINIEKVLPVAHKHDVGVLAKRPIANAAWKHPDNQPGLYKSYSKTYTDRLEQMKLTPVIAGFPQTPDGWLEMALRFTLSQAGVHTAIIGTTNPDNARANIQIANRGPLASEAVAAIRSAFQAADPQGTWLGQT